MSFKAFLLSLLVVVGFTSVSAAQSDAERTFRSLHGHDCCQNYSEFQEYCSLQGGRATANPPVCHPGGSTATGDGRSMMSFKGSPPRAIIAAALTGELVGMGLGSLYKGPDDNPQWMSGGNMGAGLMVLAAVGANSGDWGRPANSFVTMVAGAFIGAAAGQATDAGIIGGKDPVYTTSESKVVPYAAAGAGAGLATGLLFPGRHGLRLFPKGRVRQFQRGSIMGLRISW